MNEDALTSIVMSVLASQGIEEAAGVLPELDSIQLIDIVIDLEKGTGIAIPSVAIRPEAFANVQAIVTLLQSQSKVGS